MIGSHTDSGKGSLAYFAKGPLSRARSAFHLDLESNLDMGDLIHFLKSLILTTVQIDKKYRETIPDMVCKFGTRMMESSDEHRKKKQRSKKPKLGRDCLYPTEMESVGQWWQATKPELREDQISVPLHLIRSHAALLRTRETQLQMILILEILALEPLKSAEDDGCLPSLPGVSDSQGLQTIPPPAKKKNKHNLPILADVHADRLTIWQSTASDDLLTLEDSQNNVQSSIGEAQQTSSQEPLKDFSVDVIVPL